MLPNENVSESLSEYQNRGLGIALTAVGAGARTQVWPVLHLFPRPPQSELLAHAVFDLLQTSPQSEEEEHTVTSSEHVPSPSGGDDSSVQVAEHPSPSRVLPSSHSSPSST